MSTIDPFDDILKNPEKRDKDSDEEKAEEDE